MGKAVESEEKRLFALDARHRDLNEIELASFLSKYGLVRIEVEPSARRQPVAASGV
jgi:hypothetical protein